MGGRFSSHFLVNDRTKNRQKNGCLPFVLNMGCLSNRIHDIWSHEVYRWSYFDPKQHRNPMCSRIILRWMTTMLRCNAHFWIRTDTAKAGVCQCPISEQIEKNVKQIQHIYKNAPTVWKKHAIFQPMVRQHFLPPQKKTGATASRASSWRCRSASWTELAKFQMCWLSRSILILLEYENLLTLGCLFCSD